MNHVISNGDESSNNPSETEFGWRPRLKPSKEDLGWKVMKNLKDIDLIQQFHVCDICELRNGLSMILYNNGLVQRTNNPAIKSFIFEENLDRHQCDDIIL